MNAIEWVATEVIIPAWGVPRVVGLDEGEVLGGVQEAIRAECSVVDHASWVALALTLLGSAFEGIVGTGLSWLLIVPVSGIVGAHITLDAPEESNSRIQLDSIIAHGLHESGTIDLEELHGQGVHDLTEHITLLQGGLSILHLFIYGNIKNVVSDLCDLLDEVVLVHKLRH